MKPWITRIAALVLMGAGYIVQQNVIPPGYAFHGVHLAGALTAALTFLAGVGISGPQLWNGLASKLGNGAAK